MRRTLIFFCAALLVAVAVVARPDRAAAQKRFPVALPEGAVLEPGARPVLSLDGSIGFVVPSSGPALVAFAVATGEVLSVLPDVGNAVSVTIDESAARRLLALTVAGDPLEGRTGAVAIVDATDPAELRIVSTFALPESVRIAPGARAEIVHDQRIGVLPIVAPVAAVLSFDVETGEQVGALTLDGAPDALAVYEWREGSRLAVTSAESNEIAVVSLSDSGVLLPLSTFVPPDGAPISSANNVAFSGTGAVAYVASLEGQALLSFSTETGALTGRVPTEGSAASIRVYHEAERDLVAVVNISRPGGAPAPDLAPDAATPLGMPGTVVVSATPDGALGVQARFSPEPGEEIAPLNNADFTSDGGSILVPVRSGALYIVNAATGAVTRREQLDSHVQSIAVAPLAEKVAVVRAGGSTGGIEIVSLAPDADPTAPWLDPETPAVDETAEPERDRDEARKQEPPAIRRLNPGTVQSGRRHDLPVTIAGSGFLPGAVVLAGDEQYSATVGRDGKRAHFTLSASFLAAPGTVAIQVRNPDGTPSNAVALEVVAPNTPFVSRVRPESIASGVDGVDLQIRGDHFRDGAVVRATWTDPAGVEQTVDLRTYRLSFTQIVARLPRKLTQRAEQFSLRVVDRDGVAASDATAIRVVGPAIASIEPTRTVAGDLAVDEALTVKLTGSNFHRNAVVFIRRPARGDGDETIFRRVPASSVRWKSAEKMSVKLSRVDVAYSGTLVVRVVNPVPGVRAKDGDAAEATISVAGPVITATSPETIVAGSDAFFLKLDGTDFRRGATIKLRREDGDEVGARALVDDPRFKDRKNINVRIEGEQLLRLVATPGTLLVRVVNPTAGKGDPSPPREIQIVGPSVLGYELIPARNDDTEYRLTLRGAFFREGARVLLLTSEGEPVGDLRDALVKTEGEIVVRLGRRLVTGLDMFKAVVVNPGGPYNPDGVASTPIDVEVQ
jgi:hypothetical protein